MSLSAAPLQMDLRQQQAAVATVEKRLQGEGGQETHRVLTWPLRCAPVWLHTCVGWLLSAGRVPVAFPQALPPNPITHSALLPPLLVQMRRSG